MLKIGKAAQLLGITPQTLRKHAKNGDIPVTINPNTGRYYFREEDVQAYGGLTPTTNDRITIHYARSSNGDPNLIQSQLNALRTTHGDPDLTITDKGSGLNDKRPGLTRILKLVKEGKVKTIYITHPDRLTRFGYNYLLTYCQAFNTTIEPLQSTKPREPQEELLQGVSSPHSAASTTVYADGSNNLTSYTTPRTPSTRSKMSKPRRTTLNEQATPPNRQTQTLHRLHQNQDRVPKEA